MNSTNDVLRGSSSRPPSLLTLADIEDLAKWALDEFALTDRGWTFRWDRATRRAGSCNYRNKTITLSKPIYMIEPNRDHALNTVLHEVAHALTGPGAGHGPVWRARARQVGARPERCHSLETPPGRHIGTCGCGPGHDRQRPPKSGKYRCRICKVTITWHQRPT